MFEGFTERRVTGHRHELFVRSDPRVIWRDWASEVEGHGVDSGHHVAEESPDALVEAVAGFLSRRIGGPANR